MTTYTIQRLFSSKPETKEENQESYEARKKRDNKIANVGKLAAATGLMAGSLGHVLGRKTGALNPKSPTWKAIGVEVLKKGGNIATLSGTGAMIYAHHDKKNNAKEHSKRGKKL